MNEKKYDLPNGKTVVFYHDENGVGKVTLEAMDALMEMIHCQWIPCSERLPEDGTYLCWERQGFFYVDSFENGDWILNIKLNAKCIAWMPLPEPYKEKDNE